MENEEYEIDEDGMVLIPLDIDDEKLLILMKEAHAKDITFNAYIIQVLMEYIKNIEDKEVK